MNERCVLHYIQKTVFRKYNQRTVFRNRKHKNVVFEDGKQKNVKKHINFSDHEDIQL